MMAAWRANAEDTCFRCRVQLAPNKDFKKVLDIISNVRKSAAKQPVPQPHRGQVSLGCKLTGRSMQPKGTAIELRRLSLMG
jgi:hypothetical protein